MVMIIMTIIIKICNHNNKENAFTVILQGRAPNLEKSFPKLILLTFTVFF